ncbi:MAG TPA: hypothetical protein VGA13_10295 [Acidimicrobiales bacterium]
MIRLDAATVLLQWAVGGLAFLWLTTRGREVGIGYGWLLRGTYVAIAASAVVAGVWLESVPVREASAAGVAVAASVALGLSVVRRKAGVAGEHRLAAERKARVSEMTGIERDTHQRDPNAAEFPPTADLVAPAIGVIGLIAASADAGGPLVLSLARTLVGAAFLGAVSDAMLLGHWYLVQPGLPRRPLLELISWLGRLWPIEVALLLVPTGMVSAITGDVDDGAAGLLTWFWVACAVATLVLVVVTRAALRERSYSAVMAATGLLYLAILTAFGTDLVARAILTS